MADEVDNSDHIDEAMEPLNDQESASTTRKANPERRSLYGIERIPRNKSSMILRLAAQMFRKHSEMYLQQAAVLERVASNPSDPSSWHLEEPSPESIQNRLHNENVVSLAVKSYESMLEVQKRVEFMERLMVQNGLSKRKLSKPKKPTARKRQKTINEKQEPFLVFKRDHSKGIARDLNAPIDSDEVFKCIKKLWRGLNPGMRQQYAERANRNASGSAGKNEDDGGQEQRKLEQGKQESQNVDSENVSMEKPNDATSTFSSSESEDERLFRSSDAQGRSNIGEAASDDLDSTHKDETDQRDTDTDSDDGRAKIAAV